MMKVFLEICYGFGRQRMILKTPISFALVEMDKQCIWSFNLEDLGIIRSTEWNLINTPTQCVGVLKQEAITAVKYCRALVRLAVKPQCSQITIGPL